MSYFQQGQQNAGPQSYHASNYRGNQPGHDNQLRADSTQPSTTNAQGGYQSRGFSTSVPVNGFGVQSSFGQTGTAFQQQSFGGQTGQQQFGQQQFGQQQYHTANYRGNQPGHDNQLRADSTSPSSSAFQGGVQQQSRGFSTSVPVNGFGVQFGGGGIQGAQQSFGGTQQYHTQNYRGNQPGHDNQLRADSQSPSTTNARGGYSGFSTSVPVNGFGVGQTSSFGATQNVGVPSYRAQVSSQQYHTQNYRGNQPGHDNQLRADSTQPSTTNVQGGYQSRGFTTSVPVNGSIPQVGFGQINR